MTISANFDTLKKFIYINENLKIIVRFVKRHYLKWSETIIKWLWPRMAGQFTSERVGRTSVFKFRGCRYMFSKNRKKRIYLWFSFFCKSFLLFLLPGVSGAFPVWAKVLLNHYFSTTWQNSSKIPMAQTHSFRKISEPVFSEALFWCFIKLRTESLLILMFFLNFAYGEWRLESPSIIFNSPCPKLI